jgi:predicted DNA-binding protein (UPF0251 family)
VARRSRKGRKKVTQPRLPRSISPPKTVSKPAGAHQRPLNETVQLKLRFSEALRQKLEHEANFNHSSLNAEIIKRLEASFISPDRLPRLIADALLKGLHPDIEEAIRDIVIEDYRSDEAMSTYDWREEQADFEGK